MILKTGILCDGYCFKRWQKEIVDYIINHPQLELSLIVLNTEVGQGNASSSFIYRLFSYLDRKVFKVKNNAFTTTDFTDVLSKVDTVKAKYTRSGIFCEFHGEAIEKIRSYQLDVLIRFGFGIIKGEILNSAKYGVWSLHHGDNKVNRGGPPAFWEVAKQETVTGVTLQRLSEDLDGGEVIRKSFINTDTTSFFRNQNNTFWAGVELFTSSLNDLSRGSLIFSEEQDSKMSPDDPFFSLFYSYPLYKNPSNKKALRIFLSFWIRRIKEAVINKISMPQWSLFYRCTKGGKTETSLFRYKNLRPPKGYDWADPFILAHDSGYYVFFEELEIKKRRAHISCFRFDRAGKLLSNKPGKVLKEPFHLSYPFIFTENGEYYMIPEAGESREVWIYRCEQFPDRWVQYHKLFENKALYDPTLFFHNGVWFLFGTEKMNVGSSPDQYLHIYFNRDLWGDNWQAHPLNPVTRDVRGARPAGNIFRYDGRWIRPGQIGAPGYGYGIQFHEIVNLTETEYEEKAVDSILPEWKDDLKAVHTINFEKGFSVVDAQQQVF